jgi:FG-GAP-like repeat
MRPLQAGLALLALPLLVAAAPTAADVPVVTDQAPASGMYRLTNDQDSNTVVFDYNRDGVSDLILSRHQLFGTEVFAGNADGTFTLTQVLPLADRHGCDAADFNGDGWPDFYCAVGALQGTTNTKSNDLWFGTGDPTVPFSRVPDVWGAVDPAGRGRDVAAFDANGDGLTDLFVGNTYGNVYPSPNRLFLNTGTGFIEQTGAAINKSGGICVAPTDYDLDGDTDIFVCGTPNHLLRRNLTGTYTDVGKSLGLSPEQPSRDADWADLDFDGDPDLVQTSSNTLRIFTNNGNGTFTLTYQRPLTKGRNSAVADVDLNGLSDIYVVQGRTPSGSNAPDILMLDTGSSYVDHTALPNTASGGGSNVAVIPDYLGRPALVVTNGDDGGKYFKGPRQLLVFQ